VSTIEYSGYGINAFLKSVQNISTSFSTSGNNLYVGNATLNNLSQGYHNVTVWEVVYFSLIIESHYVGSVY
ncbi:MAG: hypothetical protein ACXWMS_12890, partial [Syntrophales bacterium]